MKKYLSLVLAILMLVTTLYGCGKNDNEGKVTTITFLSDGDRLEGEKLESDPVVEYIEKKFNAQFDFIFEPSPTETEVYTKLNMMMGNGDVPDVMIMRADQTLPYTAMEDLVEAGYLLDMQAYVKGKEEKFSNISELVNRDNLDVFKASDNNLYMLPREYVYDHAFIYRQDWLDELNLEMPTNETEFKNVLEAFVEADPDGKGTTGLSLVYGFWFEHILAGFVGAHRFYEQDGNLRSVWDAEGERADQMMQGLQYCIDLYQEGLIYKDVFTAIMGRDELTLFETGRAGVLLTGLNHAKRVYENVTKNFPDAKISYGVWSGPAGIARVQGGVPYYCGTAVNAKSGKADLVMEILEFLMSEEGEKLLTKGIEGVHHTVGSNGEIEPILDSEGIDYFISPYKHILREWVNGKAVFDEFVNTQPWAAEIEDYYNDYCLNSDAFYDMTDGYFSRLPKRVAAKIGNKPELTIQKWEAYFMTGLANNNKIVLTKETFKECWEDLKVNHTHELAKEYTKLILGE